MSSPSRFGLRGLMLALLTFGLISVAVDLVFLEHYEDTAMFIPFGAIALASLAILTHVMVRSPGTVLFLRIVMAILVIVGGLGVMLHYQGSLEFQVDMDPTLSRSELFWKVLHMKAPPTLAPGAMAQLGLLGLLYTYRHPTLETHRSPASQPTGESS